MLAQPLPPETIKTRLVALIQAVLLQNNQLEGMVKASNFKSSFKPVIVGLVKQFPALIGPMLETVSDEDINRVLVMLRDEFIPFLLDEAKSTPQEYTPYHIEATNEDTPKG